MCPSNVRFYLLEDARKRELQNYIRHRFANCRLFYWIFTDRAVRSRFTVTLERNTVAISYLLEWMVNVSAESTVIQITISNSTFVIINSNCGIMSLEAKMGHYKIEFSISSTREVNSLVAPAMQFPCDGSYGAPLIRKTEPPASAIMSAPAARSHGFKPSAM